MSDPMGDSLTSKTSGAETPANTGASPVPPANPLAGVSPATLDELFNRDPLSLGKQDLMTIVAALRAERERWGAAEASGAKHATKAKAPAGDKPKATLASLGLTAVAKPGA